MMKKTWSLMVFVLLVAMVVAGCSSNGKKTSSGSSSSGEGAQSGSSSSTFVLGQEQLDFTFYGHYDWYAMPEWGADPGTKWIQENLKVNVSAVQSGGNAVTKLNTMIISNELPDVIWLERGADVERLASAGMLQSYDEYLDKYPNLKNYLGEEGLNMLRSDDGKIYQFPNWYTSQPNGNAGYVVNKKIYNDLGAPKLETIDDFYNYLKLVKVTYPDVIPFEANIDAVNVLYSAFAEEYMVRYLTMYGTPNGDKLTSIFQDEVFAEFMVFVNKLFREKLMSQDVLTQTEDQMKEKIFNGKVAIFSGPSPTKYGDPGNTQLKKNDPDAGYFMIWPIHKEGLDKNKIYPGTYNQLGWNVAVITKSAKNPEAIFAFLDWMTGPEGSSVTMWGPPGLYWDSIDSEGLTVFTEAYSTDPTGRDEVMSKLTEFQWVANTVAVDQSKARLEMTLPEELRNWATVQQSTITWKTQADATQFINLDPLPESEEGIIQQQITDLYREYSAKMIVAKSEVEVYELIKEAETNAQKIGIDKMLAFMTERWQANLEKMQGN